MSRATSINNSILGTFTPAYVDQGAGGYDPAGQLTSAVLSSSSGTIHQYYYNFDAAGNRVSAQLDANVTQASPSSKHEKGKRST